MLKSPKAQQVLTQIVKLCTTESKDTHNLNFPVANTSIATKDN